MKCDLSLLLVDHSVLTRPDHLRTVFKDSNKHRKAVDNNSGYLMSQVLGQCVGLVSGNEWQTLRKVTEAPFQHKTVNAYVADVREQVKAYLHHLEAGKNFSRGMLDPALDMKMLPFFVVAQLFYGPLSAEMVERLRELAPLREELFRHVIRGGLSRFRFSRILPTRANHLLATFKKQWATFNTSAYERAVALGLDVPIISMFKAVQSSQVSMEQLLQTLDESLYANLDVTTGALSWNLVFLATNSAVQSKVRDEIISHYGDDLHSYIQSSSTLLAACTLESSRLRPLAAFSVPQSTPTDRVVDGYLIPAGTDFVVDSYALNVRHDFWGPDTKEYRPERWLELNQSDLRYHFWRFGFGPRQCMGKYVADVILRALIIELLTVYSLELSDKEQQVCGRDPNSWITHPQTLLRCTKLA